MATSSEFRRIAMSLDGTSESPHFDRTAFRAARIYATLAADGLTANVKLLPEEQAFKSMMAPQAFAPVANAWGRQGWTTVLLEAIDAGELRSVLELAWRSATKQKKRPNNKCTN
ncbi:MAG: MmcQ/YjbR family DNA-binding protein [Methylocystis sp.]